MEALLEALKATGEPTRLRIVAILARCELTVSELCRVLNQSQPRVSRHLKLLCDAGVLQRHAQGASAYFRPARSGTGRELLDHVLSLVDPDDPALAGELRRLAEVRAERAEAAAAYFESVAQDWDALRVRHVADAEVEAAMLAVVSDLDISLLLDLGTGTGRVLEIFADQIDHGIGVDLSRQMLQVARSRLDQLGARHCSVRQGNVYDIDMPAGSVDVVVLHHLLHFLDDPRASIDEAARTLRPGGRLLIVDFAPHDLEAMRTEFNHHWLGFAEDEVETWCVAAGLHNVRARHLSLNGAASATPDATPEATPVTVTLWVADQNPDAPALYTLEAAS